MPRKKSNQKVLNEFEKQNSLANLYYFNFENTTKENIIKEDVQKYDASLLATIDSVYELVKGNISKGQDKEFNERRKDFIKGYINRPITKEEANIIYNNRVSKIALEKEQRVSRTR